MMAPAKKQARSGKRQGKAVPFPFILDALAPLDPVVRPMFGGHSVYVGEKVMFMLRDHEKSPADNGLWLIFAEEFDATESARELRKLFPSLRKIRLLEGKIKHWQVIPSSSTHFETEAMQACDLVLARDPRLGRVPKSRQSKPRSSAKRSQ